MVALESYRSTHPAFGDGGESEPEWLRERRAAALARFEEVGFPSIRQEAWKYTSAKKLSRVPFEHDAHSDATVECARDRIAGLGLGDVPRVVFVNGRWSDALSETGEPSAGLRVRSMAGAIVAGEPIDAYLGLYEGHEDHAFSALNSAFLQDGAWIHAARETEGPPLHLIYVTVARGVPVVAHPRTLVVADPLAQVSVVEHHIGAGDHRGFANAVTELVVGQGARVGHCHLARPADDGFLVHRLRVQQGRDSRVDALSVSLGGGWVRNDVDAVLNGAGAEIALDGLYLPMGDEHIDNHTSVDHAVARCVSRELYKGVLADRSRGVFNGRILMREGAVGSDSEQANHNLLLSTAAEIDTKPELEIYNDDVKAAHGTTIGRLDEGQLFYLRSRGVDHGTARQMLTEAFIDEVVERVLGSGLRAHVRERVGRRLRMLQADR